MKSTSTPLTLSQRLNLPSPTLPTNTYQNGLPAKSPTYKRRTNNPGTPNAENRMAHQVFAASPEKQAESLRFLIDQKGGAIGGAPRKDKNNTFQNAPKNPKRRQKAGTLRPASSRVGSTAGMSETAMTPRNVKKGKNGSTSSLNQRSNSSRGGTLKVPISSDKSEKVAQATAGSKRPPMRAPGAAQSTQKSTLPQNQAKQRQSSLIYNEQFSGANSSNLMMHSSAYEDSQPMISATAATPQTYYHKQLLDPAQQRAIRKQGTGDNLDINEEHHRKQLEDFASAKTHLYEFQVRKSPLRNIVEPDEGPPPFLQIPKESNNKENQMFLHPYPHMDHYSEESTRFNTKRNGDSSGTLNNTSRVRRDKIGHSQTVLSCQPTPAVNEKEQMSLTQSIFSPLWNLVSGKSSSKDEASSQSVQGMAHSTFSSKAECATSAKKREEKDRNYQPRASGSRANKENPHIQIIQETTEPMQTELLGEGSFNERSNTTPYYQQWMQMETEVHQNNNKALRAITSDSSLRMNTLSGFTRQGLGGFGGLQGRNDIMRTQHCMGGFSTLSKSPIKSRKFTQPPQKPAEDEIVESMNIITIDMVPEESKQNRAMRISEPLSSECIGEFADCLSKKNDADVKQHVMQQTQPQQRTTNNTIQQTVCSCSGCMASQTAYEPQEPLQTSPGQKPTRICLETVLSECDQVRSLLSLLHQPKSQQVMILQQKRILLDRIQTYCEEWWGASSQFHNLHAVFEQDGTPEGQKISNLIKKSQVVLCVGVGLIASLSIDVQNSNFANTVISQTFWLPRLFLQDAYFIQIKLTSIILRKMERQERQSNEFAIKLLDRINRFKLEYNTGNLLPDFSQEGDEASRLSLSSENSQELENFLANLVDNQVSLLEQQCCDTVPEGSSSHTFYSNLFTVALSEITDLSVAKDLIAAEVNSIQENCQRNAEIQPEEPTGQREPNNVDLNMSSPIPTNALHPPEIQATPQVPSSTASMVEPAIINPVTPIDEQLQAKHRILTQGHLSEIGEEPCNILSTEQNGAPSVERDISRISSNQSNSGIQQYLALAQKETSSQEQPATKVEQELSHHIEPATALEVSQQMMLEATTEEGPAQTNILPPATKKYILVLDLDETLIHSHVQYKEMFKTRAQQQEYFNELANKFISEYGREPTKEELENLALEMVFNIRPFAEEFLNTMAKEFELIIFTAGEQDYADEILNTLDQGKAITHRLYRQHTSQVKDAQTGATRHYIKDLSLIGRDLSKTIIIDNIKENFIRQPRNGIQITTWKDDPYDTELMILQRLLLNMSKREPDDLRVNLDRLKEHGLLPYHYAEPLYDESSSFQHFEPVVVAATNQSSIDEKNNVQGNAQLADGKNSHSLGHNNLLTVERNEHSQSMVSVDSCRSTSVRQKSVANSSYQRRRLSANSVKQDEQIETQNQSIEAENFFVDDVPIRVQIDTSPGANVTHTSLKASTNIKEDSQEYNATKRSSAFVDTSADAKAMYQMQ